MGSVVSRFAGVITAPVYTRYLTTAEYGEFDLALSIAAILGIFLMMEMQSGYGRSYYEAKSISELTKLRGSVLIFYAVLFSLVLIVFVVLSPVIETYFNVVSVDLLWPLLARAFPAALISLLMVTLRFEKKPILFSFLAIANLFLTAFSGVFVVSILGFKIEGILWSNAIVSMVVCLLSFIFYHSYWRFEINFSYLKELIKYSLPILPATLSGWINQYIGRIFIAGSLSLSLLGIYSIALKVGLIMTLSVTAFKQAWTPLANQFMSQGKTERQFAKMLNDYLMIFFLLLVLIVTASPVLVKLLAPEEYYLAVSFVGLIALANMWDGVTVIVASGNNWVRKTYYNMIGSIAAAIVSLTFLYFYIENGGLLIVAVTLSVVSIIKTIINYFTAQHNHRIPYSISRISLFLIISSSYAMGSYFLFENVENWVINSLVLFLIGVFLLFLLERFLYHGSIRARAMKLINQYRIKTRI